MVALMAGLTARSQPGRRRKFLGAGGSASASDDGRRDEFRVCCGAAA
jgi:hypothetical protein